MLQSNDLSRSLSTLNQDSTLIVVIEMSQSSWLVAGMVPGVERQPLKKMKADENELLKLVGRWRDEAVAAGREITRVVAAYEAGRDGFWLARWLLESEGLRLMSFIPRASPCHANTDAPRRPSRHRTLDALVSGLATGRKAPHSALLHPVDRADSRRCDPKGGKSTPQTFPCV